MKEYYARRAQEYEAIYHRADPQRQAEQAAIAEALREALRGRSVLEIACGTGYWTQVVAEVARRIVALDAAQETLAVARAKGLPVERVEFREGDAYALEGVPGNFDAGLANFWFSHVPRARIGEFLRGLHSRLGVGAVVFMADNVYVPGVGGELVTKPGVEDSFKLRRLADGSTHEVLKNYYDEGELRRLFEPLSADLQLRVGSCFWWISYRIAPPIA